MKIFSSLDAKDRRLLLWSLGIAISLAVLIGFAFPNENGNDNPLPSTYLAGQHGARAAFDTLLRSGYRIERWERPLTELAATASPNTVVIFAQPFTRETEDIKAVQQIVEQGGRVLSTGFWGGFLLPGGETDNPGKFAFAPCKLEPEGLDSLADSGDAWMVPTATWRVGNPNQRIQYSCAGQPAVVEYEYGNGHIVWWASATPLENGSLSRDQDFDLLLNSIGPREGHHFYWDESLHGEARSQWSYVTGPAMHLLWIGLGLTALLVIFSFSRRSGPVRDLPPPARAMPIEFLEALGSLYRNAGAASTVVAIAWERFRRQTLRLCGLRQGPMSAVELGAVIRKRFPAVAANLETDLTACEDAALSDSIDARAALKIIQTLHGHQQMLYKTAKLGNQNTLFKGNHSNPHERAS